MIPRMIIKISQTYKISMVKIKKWNKIKVTVNSHMIKKGKLLKNGILAIFFTFIIGLNTNFYNIDNCVLSMSTNQNMH